MQDGKTAGELAYKAASDSTKYNSLDVGHALVQDIARELMECAQRHRDIFNEDEYCVGYVIASDPLIHNLMRRKFFAMLYLPSPRPNQCVFLYNKRWDRFTKRLWTLPNPATMAELSEMLSVAPQYREMKQWCDAFFGLRFWPYIRKQHKIDMLSESEYLERNREELIKASGKECPSSRPDTFDFAKVAADKIVNPKITSLNQSVFDSSRQTQNLYGSICTHKT